MDDITTVIDAVGCKRVVVFGHGDGGPIAMLFAANYPERTEAIVLGDTCARIRHAADYPDGLSGDAAEKKAARLYEFWGREDRPLPMWRARVEAFSDPSFVAWRASTVKYLVVGSGLNFQDRGNHAHKGVEGEWRLFAAA